MPVTRRAILLATSAATAVAVLPAIARDRRPSHHGHEAPSQELSIRLRRAAAAGAPIAFGRAYARGDVPAGDSVTVTPASGETIELLVDQANRWPDGSLRFSADGLHLPNSMGPGQIMELRRGAARSEPL